MNPPPISCLTKLLCRSTLVLGISFGVLSSAHAQQSWTGLGGDALWATPGNWSDETLPDADTDVVFDSSRLGSGTPSLGGASYSIHSLTFDGTTNMSLNAGSGAPSLTLGTGNVTKNNTSSVTIGSNVILGANGTWSNAAAGGNAQALRFNGVISGSYGAVKQGSGDLILAGNNTFGGGLEVQAGSLWVLHSNALGTGTLTMKNAAGADLWFGTSGMEVANDITLSNSGGVGFRSSAASPFYTLSGDITGSLNNGGFSFRGNPATWVVKGAISLTGLSAAGLGLNSEAAGGFYTLILEQSPSVSGAINGRYLIGNSGVNAGRANFLVSKAITLNGAYLDLDNSNGINTVGGIQSEGTVVFKPSVRLFNATTGAGNLATLHAGAVSEFAGQVTDLTKTIHLHINETWKMHTETSGATVIEQTPKGTVLLSYAAGNVYKGGTTVHAGTLLVANTSGSGTGTGAVTVQSGATLGGSGIIAPEGAEGVTVKSGAVLSGTAGLRLNGAAATGAVLTMEEGAAFRFDLAAPGTAPGIRLWNYVSGALVLNDNAIDITDAGGLTAGDYTLFAFYADNGVTPIASGLLAGLHLGSGLESFAGSYLSFQGDSIVLHVVPEPGTWGLLAMGAAALLIRCKRRA